MSIHSLGPNGIALRSPTAGAHRYHPGGDERLRFRRAVDPYTPKTGGTSGSSLPTQLGRFFGVRSSPANPAGAGQPAGDVAKGLLTQLAGASGEPGAILDATA